MPRRRLAYLTQWFPPEEAGPALWIAQAMQERGFDVVVATGIPNYPSGLVTPGYRARTPVRETTEGFRVLRSPLYPSHDNSAVGRVLNYASFALSSSWFASPVLKTADITLVYTSPATAALAAMVAHQRFGTPYVLYIQDLWPDSIFATGFLTQVPAQRSAEVILTPFLHQMYENAAHIAVITQGMKDVLINRGVPTDKLSVVYNWVDEEQFRPIQPNGKLRSHIGAQPNDLTLVYAGNHGNAQGLHAWIDAMALVRDLPDVRLVLIGEGTQKQTLKEQATSLDLNHVHFLDPVPSSAIAALASDADALVVSLADDPLFQITMPGKTQTCLAQGKAVLASVSGDAARVLDRAGAGWCARPEDATTIAHVIRKAHAAGREALQERGQRARDFYLTHMSKNVGSASLENILRTAQ